MPDLKKTKLNLPLFLTLCFGGFALVVAAAFAIMPPSRPDTSNETVIASFEGTGSDTTDFFTVEKGWEIQWETPTIETLQSIAWKTAEGKGSMIMQMHRKPLREHGRVNVNTSGTYHLDITANGPWKITIYQF